MSDLREASKGGLRASYHGEELLITSIKYTRVVTTIVEESLPVKPVSDAVSVMTSKDGTKDSEQPLSESVSNEEEVLGKPGAPASGYSKLSDGVKSVRNYSTHTRTHTRSPVQVSDSVSLVPYVKSDKAIVPYVSGFKAEEAQFHSEISLLRSENGSFYLNNVGLLTPDSINLRIHLRQLIALLNGLKKELESVNSNGYCNLTRISDVPVLSGYLINYVNSDIIDSLSSDGNLSSLSSEVKVGLLNDLDAKLSLREKRVLLP
jgi:hypothetical protein